MSQPILTPAVLAGTVAVLVPLGLVVAFWRSSSSSSEASPSEGPSEPELSPERQAIVQGAIDQLGTLYQWGGGHGPGGYGVDCSGMVIRAHQAAGQPLPPCGLATSNGWWQCLERITTPIPGDLALYGRKAEDRAVHVEMVTGFDGENAETIGSQGGDKDVLSPEIAQARNANVRLSSTKGRTSFLGFVRNPIEAQAAKAAEGIPQEPVSMALQNDEA